MAARPRPTAKSKRPQGSLEQEAFVTILRTADRLLRDVDRVLEPDSLSHTQYNVLRILRGAGPGGLSCSEVGERMLTRDPDVTRLLNRLEARNLARRWRERRDRRVIKARITDKGLALLRDLDRPILETHKRQLRRLGPRRLRNLLALLDAARSR